MANPNPYESPRVEATTLVDDKEGLWLAPLVLVIVWTAFLFFGLPAVQHIPIVLRVVSTIVTLSVLLLLIRACRRIWHWAAFAPIVVVMCTLQYLVWVFPSTGG